MTAKAEIEEHHVQLGEVADGIYDRHTLNNPPSLQALKLQDMLMKNAGVTVCEDRWHRMDLAAIKRIKGMRNAAHDDVVELFRQLRSATLTYRNEVEGYTGIYGLISVGRVEFEDHGVIRYRFDEEFRKVLEHSNLYAVLDRQTSLALSSRYAHRLHEMIALRAGRDKNVERFTVDDLRARLGVPNGKLKAWIDFRRFALEMAIDEVNQLSRFEVSWRVCRKFRRRVEEIELTWEVKRALTPTRAELARSKVGRKARRTGAAETPVAAFPEGRISYSQWEIIAKEALPSPRPDVNLVADWFRAFCAERGISLDSASIEKTFRTFCAKQQPAR